MTTIELKLQGSDKILFINPKKIILFHSYNEQNNGTTIIYLSNGHKFHVEETVDEIDDKLLTNK